MASFSRPSAVSFSRLGVLLAASTVLFGCSETNFEEATGKGQVRGIHAVAALDDVTFLIEEFGLGTIAFKASSATAPYDDLSYTFNFDLPFPDGSAPARVASLFVDVVADTEYSFVLAGTPGTEQIFLWERPEREWAGTETTFDVVIGHANSTAGSVDVFLAADGTTPVAGNEIGTLAFGERLDPLELEGGDYELILTRAGDPADILYRGTTATIGAAQSYVFLIADADPSITAPVAVRLINAEGTAAEIPDERFSPTVQFFNTSFESGAIDIIVDGDFANPAVSNLAFGALSDDIVVAADSNVQFVPTGNTMPLIELDLLLGVGTRNMLLLLGDSADLRLLQLPALRRGLSTAAQLRLTNTGTDTDAVNIYTVAPGTVIDTSTFPAVFQRSEGFTAFVKRTPGDIEISVTNGDVSATLAGPEPATLAVNETLDLFVLDTADPNVASIVLVTN